MIKPTAAELKRMDPWPRKTHKKSGLLARVDAVTLEGAMEACEAFFHPDRQTVVHLGPA